MKTNCGDADSGLENLVGCATGNPLKGYAVIGCFRRFFEVLVGSLAPEMHSWTVHDSALLRFQQPGGWLPNPC